MEVSASGLSVVQKSPIGRVCVIGCAPAAQKGLSLHGEAVFIKYSLLYLHSNVNRMSSILLMKVPNPVTLRVNTMYKEEYVSCTQFSMCNSYLVPGIYEIPVIKIYINLRGYEKHPIGRNEPRNVEIILLILQGIVVVPLGSTPRSLHFTVTVYLRAPYDFHSTEPFL